MSKARNYIFTINNYTDDILKEFTNTAKSLKKHQYICYGLEIAPTTGTKHIQGYIQLSDNQAFTFLHNYFDLQKDGERLKFHLQPARGTLKENQVYTQKAGEWFEFGVPKKAGRSDLTRLRELVMENPYDRDRVVKEECSNLQQIKYVEKLYQYLIEPRDPDTPSVVFWIYGTPGIGKTKLVHDSFDSVFTVSDLKWPGDGYGGEECFLIDDYRSEDMSFQQLLRITDRYPYKIAYKGGSIHLNSPYIVITCPNSINKEFSFLKENLKQLKRRISAEINLDSEEIKDLRNYKKLEDF